VRKINVSSSLPTRLPYLTLDLTPGFILWGMAQAVQIGKGRVAHLFGRVATFLFCPSRRRGCPILVESASLLFALGARVGLLTVEPYIKCGFAFSRHRKKGKKGPA
jgi:hypothetical protein